jgi:Protein of unknown function (DUF1804).
MAETEKRVEAERLYVKAKLLPKDIARALKVSETSVYRWRAEAAAAGEEYDWDRRRRDATPVNIVDVQRQYWEALSKQLKRIQEDETLLLDPKVADAIAKHIAAINRLVPKKTWLSACVSVLDEIKSYLAANDPELWERFVGHIPAIQDALERQVLDL